MDFTLYSLSSLIAWTTAFAMGLFVFFNNWRGAVNRAYLFLSVCITIWVSGCFMESTFIDPNFNLFIDKFLYTGAAFAPMAFLHSILIIIDKSKQKQKLLILGYLCSLAFLLLNYYFRPTFITAVTHRISFRYIALPGTLWYWYIFFFIATTFYGLYELYKENLASKGMKKNKLFYLSIAYTTVIIAAAFYLLLVFNIETPPIDNLLVVVYSFMMAYAITKHELMDIRLAISRSAAYGIVGILLVASFTGLNLMNMSIPVSIVANALLGLFWAWAAHRLRTFIQTPLIEKWITDFYDSDKLINSIVKGLAPIIEKEAAFDLIAEELKQNIKIKKIELLKPNETNKNLRDIIYDSHQTGVLIPLYSSDGLEGVLAVGPKVSEDLYNEKDLTLFRTIMIQVQVVLDRIRPYEKIQLELEAATKELERSQRLASIGTLIAGVTHEIRNPMTLIRGKMETYFDKPRDESYLKECRKIILENADRIGLIVQRMLNAAKGKEQKVYTDVNLNEVIEKTLCLFNLSRIRLVKDYKPIPLIKGDSDDLLQVFINLIQNAIEAMAEGGTITLRAYIENEKVVAEVSDTGKDIPKEIKEKIFDPFFSTRHEGTGLGLSIVYRIIREHGADIKVESQEGQGTTFKLVFLT